MSPQALARGVTGTGEQLTWSRVWLPHVAKQAHARSDMCAQCCNACKISVYMFAIGSGAPGSDFGTDGARNVGVTKHRWQGDPFPPCNARNLLVHCFAFVPTPH